MIDNDFKLTDKNLRLVSSEQSQLSSNDWFDGGAWEYYLDLEWVYSMFS